MMDKREIGMDGKRWLFWQEATKEKMSGRKLSKSEGILISHSEGKDFVPTRNNNNPEYLEVVFNFQGTYISKQPISLVHRLE